MSRWAAVLAVFACVLVGPARADGTGPLPAGSDFGAGLTLTRPTPLVDVLRDPERFAEEPVLVRGRVAEVCQRKGCWTILRDGSAHVRVRFQNYAFFMPKDCVGDETFVQGVVQVRTLSEREARHYEAESRGGQPSRIEGPQREVGFVATGLRLVGRE